MVRLMETPPHSPCISAVETRTAYLALVASQACGDGSPCLRDDCSPCARVNHLIDLRGQQCEARGCTLARCVFQVPQ